MLIDRTVLKRFIFGAMAAGVVWAATAAFDVASIKPAQLSNPMDAMHGNARIGMKVDGARVDIANLTVMDLIRIAYAAKPYQIVAPEWMKGHRWDIQATLPKGATPEQVPAMLQALLAERFKLAVHREMREHAVYALVVGKSGPNMKEAEPQVPGTADHGRAAGMQVNEDARNVFLTSEPLGPVMVSPVSGGAGIRLGAQGASMTALADMLSRLLDRPVVDLTRLKGKYEVALDLSPENIRTMASVAGFAMAGMGAGGRGPAEGGMHGVGDGAPASEPGATVFQSVLQLGLKLEARKAPMETIVVDHAEKSPTEN